MFIAAPRRWRPPEHIEKAKVLESRGQMEETALELKRALALDHNNSIALDWLPHATG